MVKIKKLHYRFPIILRIIRLYLLPVLMMAIYEGLVDYYCHTVHNLS